MATAREVCPPQVSLVSIAPLGAKKRRPVDGRATAWLVSRNRYTANAATMALTIRMNRSGRRTTSGMSTHLLPPRLG